MRLSTLVTLISLAVAVSLCFAVEYFNDPIQWIALALVYTATFAFVREIS